MSGEVRGILRPEEIGWAFSLQRRPAPEDSGGLRRLIESGELRPARRPLPLFSEDEAGASDSVGSDAVVADRYEGSRW